MGSEVNWDEYYNDYDLGVGSLIAYRRHLADIVRDAELAPFQRVLETGCGSGLLMRAMLDRYPDLNIVGIDNNDRALAAAREKFANCPNVHLQKVDLDADVWGVQSGFDRVVSAMTLYALKDPVAYMRKVRSSLRSHGLLVLVNLADKAAVANALSVQENWLRNDANEEERAHEERVRSARDRVIAFNRAALAHFDFNLTSASELERLAVDSGFDMCSVDPAAYAGCAARIVARAR